MKTFHIEAPAESLREALRHKIDFKTKPAGALGRLEDVALQIGLIQGTLTPALNNPHLVVFAGDHGVAEEGVSAYPQDVTWQMVYNFLAGGAAINVFCRQHGIGMRIVDAGVKRDFEPHPDLLVTKVRPGTANFTRGPAMSLEEAEVCVERGAQIVSDIHRNGCNVIGFGDMGIGNTTSASALMHAFTGIDVRQCVGKGTGVSDDDLLHKADVIRRALRANSRAAAPLQKLAAFGGFEIAQMAGAMLQAADRKMVVLVDGFIASAAFLAAHVMNANVLHYAVFCHQSEERGHRLLLEHLGVKPLLSLNMRLGEGTGCAVAYPVIRSAVAFLNEMASFESAGVSGREEHQPA